MLKKFKNRSRKKE